MLGNIFPLFQKRPGSPPEPLRPPGASAELKRARAHTPHGNLPIPVGPIAPSRPELTVSRRGALAALPKLGRHATPGAGTEWLESPSDTFPALSRPRASAHERPSSAKGRISPPPPVPSFHTQTVFHDGDARVDKGNFRSAMRFYWIGRKSTSREALIRIVRHPLPNLSLVELQRAANAGATKEASCGQTPEQLRAKLQREHLERRARYQYHLAMCEVDELSTLQDPVLADKTWLAIAFRLRSSEALLPSFYPAALALGAVEVFLGNESGARRALWRGLSLHARVAEKRAPAGSWEGHSLPALLEHLGADLDSGWSLGNAARCRDALNRGDTMLAQALLGQVSMEPFPLQAALRQEVQRKQSAHSPSWTPPTPKTRRRMLSVDPASRDLERYAGGLSLRSPTCSIRS